MTTGVNIMKTFKITRKLSITRAIGLALFLLPIGVIQAEIKNVNANQYGNTWGEWTTRWAQWRFSFPVTSGSEENAALPDCQIGQSGPVWLLSTFDQSGVYNCTIPSGKTILLPAATHLAGAATRNCEPTAPGVPCYISELRKITTDLIDRVSVSATLDGKKLTGLSKTRVTSPEFSLTLPDSNFFKVDPGTYFPNVMDGYFIMLKPLKPGTHRIVINLQIGSAQATRTYNLNVIR